MYRGACRRRVNRRRLVGAPGVLGSAYVFTPQGSTWTEQAKLTASDGTAGDFFGRSVAVHGGTAVVGAPSDTLAQGSAYIFAGLRR